VWTSVGDIAQEEFASIVNSGLMKGEVKILSGVHGYADGTTAVDIGFYVADAAKFGGYPGVTVLNYAEMSAAEVGNVINGTGTIIGGFCNSGACLLSLLR